MILAEMFQNIPINFEIE